MKTPPTSKSPADSNETHLPCLDAGSLGRRIVASLPTLFARGVSLHDASGHCHWRSSESNTASEYLGVRAALDAFIGKVAPSRVDVHLQDGTSAVLLISRSNNDLFVGFVLLLVDTTRIRGKGRAAPDLPIPVVRAADHWGELAPMHAAGLAAAAIESSAAQANMPAVAQRPPDKELSRLDRLELERYSDAVRSLTIRLHAQRLLPQHAEVRIRRYEILLREENDDQVAPAAFLRSADAAGAGPVLDRRVVDELLGWLQIRARIWHDEPSQFSVNLSAGTLLDAEFTDFVIASLANTELPAGILAFEIDRATAVAQPELVRQFAIACARSKAGIVLDNFTLNDNGFELLDLPGLRLIKIDRSLTSELPHKRSNQAIVAGIAQMARVAGIHSVAKQVDNIDENSLLARLGVDFIQSFAASAPMSLEALQNELTQRVIVDNSALIDQSLPEFLRTKPGT